MLTSLQFFIAPVSYIHFRGKDLEVPLASIMYGREQHEWGVVVYEEI